MNLRTILTILAALVLVAGLPSCGDPLKSPRGFHLPGGSIEKGKQAFVTLNCHSCHSVEGVELPPFGGSAPFDLKLGGEVIQVQT